MSRHSSPPWPLYDVTANIDFGVALLGLTPAQARVARQVARGLSRREIADELHVDEQTVKNHVREIHRRTGAHTPVQLLRVTLGAAPKWEAD